MQVDGEFALGGIRTIASEYGKNNICFASLTFNRAGIPSTSPGRACMFFFFLFSPLQFIFRYTPEYMTRAIETVSSNNI